MSVHCHKCVYFCYIRLLSRLYYKGVCDKWSNHPPHKKTQTIIKSCCSLLCSRTIMVQHAYLQQDQFGTVLHTKQPRARHTKQEIRQVQIQTFCIVAAWIFLYTGSCTFYFIKQHQKVPSIDTHSKKYRRAQYTQSNQETYLFFATH